MGWISTVFFGIADADDSRNYCKTAYNIPNFYVEQVLSDLPIPIRYWRSIQNTPNAFVMESLMDELALAAGKGFSGVPFTALANQYAGAKGAGNRLLKGPAGGKPVAKGTGRGIAQHTCMGTYIAAVADVSVNDTGKIKVSLKK